MEGVDKGEKVEEIENKTKDKDREEENEEEEQGFIVKVPIYIH